MDNLSIYHQGDNIAILLQTTGGRALEEYRIDAFIYTTGNGPVIKASTRDCGDCIPVTIRTADSAVISLTSDHTRSMDPGVCFVEVRYTHNDMAVVRTIRSKVFRLKYSKALTNECEHGS